MPELAVLSSIEISKFASRSGVKKIAVENFLGSLGDLTLDQALGNVQLDAGLYRWNTPTVNAIRAGIFLATRKARMGLK